MNKYYANMISWMALFINVLVIMIVTKYNLNPSWYFLGTFIACFLDMFDGMVARKYNVDKESKIMGELTDSLCDVVNFGVFPIVIYWMLYSSSNLPIIFIVSCLYLWASVFRLARFSSIKIESGYLGLPITIAGLIIMFLNIFIHNFMLISVCYLLLALLMASKIRVKKIKIGELK